MSDETIVTLDRATPEMPNEAIAPIDQPTPEMLEARARIDLLRRDGAWCQRFAAADADARQEMSRLIKKSAGEPCPAITDNTPKPPAPSPADAKARIELLRRDSAWCQRFAAGDAVARQEIKDLHEAAFGIETEQRLVDTHYEKAFDNIPVDVTGADEALAAEARLMAKEAAINLGFEPEVTTVALQILQQGMAARQNRPMEPSERGELKDMLKARWGGSYTENLAKFDEVFRGLGRGGEWLLNAIVASGPKVAAEVVDTIVTEPRRRRA